MPQAMRESAAALAAPGEVLGPLERGLTVLRVMAGDPDSASAPAIWPARPASRAPPSTGSRSRWPGSATSAPRAVICCSPPG